MPDQTRYGPLSPLSQGGDTGSNPVGGAARRIWSEALGSRRGPFSFLGVPPLVPPSGGTAYRLRAMASVRNLPSGRWQLRVDIGRDPLTSTRRWATRTVEAAGQPAAQHQANDWEVELRGPDSTSRKYRYLRWWVAGLSESRLHELRDFMATQLLRGRRRCQGRRPTRRLIQGRHHARPLRPRPARQRPRRGGRARRDVLRRSLTRSAALPDVVWARPALLT